MGDKPIQSVDFFEARRQGIEMLIDIATDWDNDGEINLEYELDDDSDESWAKEVAMIDFRSEALNRDIYKRINSHPGTISWLEIYEYRTGNRVIAPEVSSDDELKSRFECLSGYYEA